MTALRVACGISVGALALLAWEIAGRVAFPYALEWQEAAMLEHSLRVAAGEALYVEPSPSFAPFPYPPLFHWLGATATALLGPTLPALRMVSVLSTVAVLGCVFALARRRGGAPAGLIASGVLAAAYTFTGQWLDVARVDALALALMAATLLVATSGPALRGSIGAGVAAGLLACLAVLAKQIALPFAAALALGLAVRAVSRRAGIAMALATAGSVGASVLWLENASDGWFLFTTVDVLAGSPWHGPAVLGFWWECAVPFAPILVLFAVGRETRGERPEDRGPDAPEPVSPALALGLVALVLVAWAGRAHEGGVRNTLLPAALAGALVAGPAAARAARLRPRVTALWVVALFGVLLLAYPRSPRPSAADRAEAERLVQRIESLDGPVWQPHGAVDPAVSGGVHAMTINDLLKSRESDAARRFVDALRSELEARRYAGVVLGVEPAEWADLEALWASYAVAERLDDVARGNEPEHVPFTPPTGAPRRPRVLLLPR
ncbi:MAG: glycosyltransferase family 39 protein [Planctomycetota bacterium]